MDETKHSIQDYVRQLNKLYISYRKKFIIQNDNGSYTTLSQEKNGKQLTDSWLTAHLKQTKTLGIFSGRDLTKVIGFDVDMNEDSPLAAVQIIETLINGYGIEKESILASFSGSKGYHIDVFLDKMISIKKAKQLYFLVLQDLNYNFTDIEFRPTEGQGYKLPLSVHRKSGKVACIVDPTTLKELPAEALFNVVQGDAEALIETISLLAPDAVKGRNELVLDVETAEQLEDVIDGMEMFIPTDYRESMGQILTENMLLYKDTRHRVTLHLSIFLKEQGFEQDQTAEIVGDVISNTFKYRRELIDAKTTLESAIKECYRLAKVVYDKGYTVGQAAAKPVRLYKEDILLTLQPKRKEQRQLLFSMICHSKRYAKPDGTFYMSYSVMTKVGNTANRGRLAKQTKQLEDLGLINVVQRNERNEKSLKSETNVYSVNQTNKTFENSAFIELDSINVEDWARVTTQLFSQKELRKLVSRQVFNETFKHYYTVGTA